MPDRKRESSEALMPGHKQRGTRIDHSASKMPDQAVTQSIVDAYDALDYRLMATFPASDAVARY